jgi:DNA repair exonuclease SbcCD nuclease subunit
MLNCIVTSDWHLDCFHYSKMFDFQDRDDLKYQIYEIEKPFIYAIDNGIPDILILGDIGDRHLLTTDAQIELLRLFLKYDELLNIHIIIGNHDFSDLDSNSMNLFGELYQSNKFKTVKIYKDKTDVKIGGVNCRFLPFPLEDISNRHLNFIHLNVKGAKLETGKVLTRGLDEPDINCISGHVHGYQKLGKVTYCGSLYQTDFGSKLPKGFIHLQAMSHNKVRHRFINSSPAFELRNLVVNEEKDLLKISNNKLHFYKLKFNIDNVPDYVRSKYPNIVDLTSTYKIEAKMIESFEPDIGLEDYLFDYGLDDYKVKRGVELVKHELAKVQK